MLFCVCFECQHMETATDIERERDREREKKKKKKRHNIALCITQCILPLPNEMREKRAGE